MAFSGANIHVVLAKMYIEALLVDEELADQVWEAWDKGEIVDPNAWLPGLLIAGHYSWLNVGALDF